MGVRGPRHGRPLIRITISIVLSTDLDLRLMMLMRALRLRRITRSTAACRVVLGFFTDMLHFAFLRLGRAGMAATPASSPSSSAMPCFPPEGRLDRLRASTLAPRTMLRHTASTCGVQEVSPRDVDTPRKRGWGLHLGQGTSPRAASPSLLRAGTAGSLPLAPAAELCSG